jgi:hypothetical protein
MWHTHILSSIELYNQDCLRICNHKFYHDDSLGDRTPGAKLDLSFQQTESLWRRHYGNEAYKVDGTLYRGEPSQEFFHYSTWKPVVEQEVENVGKLQHTGASSAGNQLTTLEWRSARRDVVSSTGEPLFIPANVVKTEPNGVDLNPHRPGYAFGFGSQGWGYYSLETKEWWEHIWMRLKTSEAMAQAELDTLQCKACSFWAFRGPPSSQLSELDAVQSRIADIRMQKREVKRIIEASRATTPLQAPDDQSRVFSYGDIMSAAACGGAL